MSKKGRNISSLIEETNPSAYKKERRRLQRCSLCPPNRIENANRQEKKSWKTLSKRERQYKYISMENFHA